MKRFIVFLALVMILLTTISPAAEEASSLRGKKLYDAWSKLGLAKTTGTMRVTWLPDGMGWLESEDDKVTGGTIFYRVDPVSRRKSRLFDAAIEKAIIDGYNKLTGKTAAGLPFKSFSYLPGNDGLRFAADRQQEFVFFFKDKTIRKLDRPAGQAPPSRPSLPPERMAFMAGRFPRAETNFSPDFTKYLYNKAYDLWIYDLATKTETQLTKGGSEELMNGKTDWVYPEELRQSEAFWWSPDGSRVAYLQFDERTVYNFPIIHELTPERKPAFETSLELERYPKAGKPNPTVKLFVIDVATEKTTEVKSESGPDVYLTRIEWRNDGKEIFFQRLNRFQNRLELMPANPASGDTRTVLVEEEECFIELHNDFRQLADGKRFAWSSERTGWKHLYLYDMSGRLLAPLTQGEWEASRISLLDEKNGWVYFSIDDNFGLDSHFGRVKLDGTKLIRLTGEPGTHRVSIDPAGTYYIDNFSSLAVPTTVTLNRADGKLIATLASTDIDKVKEIGLQEPELVKLKAADGQTDIFGILFKPADFDPNKKYPLYVQVYGGPSHRNSNS